jgi:hypothetical protein
MVDIVRLHLFAGLPATWASRTAHDSPLLVFSTGRSLELYKQLRTERHFDSRPAHLLSGHWDLPHRDRPRAGWRWLAELESIGRNEITQHLVSAFSEFTCPQSNQAAAPQGQLLPGHRTSLARRLVEPPQVRARRGRIATGDHTVAAEGRGHPPACASKGASCYNSCRYAPRSRSGLGALGTAGNHGTWLVAA